MCLYYGQFVLELPLNKMILLEVLAQRFEFHGSKSALHHVFMLSTL